VLKPEASYESPSYGTWLGVSLLFSCIYWFALWYLAPEWVVPADTSSASYRTDAAVLLPYAASLGFAVLMVFPRDWIVWVKLLVGAALVNAIAFTAAVTVIG
jgi:hypothetical protein